MATITVQADEVLVGLLAEIARTKHISLQDAAREALLLYVDSEQGTAKQRYSFIGIGHSGKGDLSQRVDETLMAGADRTAGWSLSH